MENFKEVLLKSKKISIWGIGYLGYTTVLRLQKNGFYAMVYDFNESRLDDLVKNDYPNKEQLNGWSKNGKVPILNFDKLEIVKDNSRLFDNHIHIISFPNHDNFNYLALAKLFIRNRDKLENSLIIFQSAGIPKTIERDFCKIFKEYNLNIEVSTVFRSDWIVEDFFNKNFKRIISGNNKNAI
ncbi:MAG: hypothetical protein GXP61_09770, partial [Epsilonproteobacteria bacterium]|nr:hypothetical protein [Campylobacterota bacterium]